MRRIYDKILIFSICSIIYLFEGITFYSVIPILIVFIVSSFIEYINNVTKNFVINNICLISMFVLSLYYSDISYFIPIFIYDISNNYFKIAYTIPAILNEIIKNNISYRSLIFILFICILSEYLRKLTNRIDTLEDEYIIQRDTNKEYEIELKNKNKELIYSQNDKILSATLDERNRIARDIHDNVGHILSSSLLQIGAMVVAEKDEEKKEKLKVLKSTLDNGMNNIRDSIHNIYNDSIDLKLEIEKIIDEFNSIDIQLKYYINGNTLSNELKTTFIYIIKEAITNTVKHSNASVINITLIEHPAMYKILIHDNGNTTNKYTFDDIVPKGIGLNSITTRVKLLNGVIDIQNSDGFKIWVTIPNTKERK